MKTNQVGNRFTPLVLICVGVVLFIFISYEILERLWLIHVFNIDILNLLHIVRGIGTSLIIGFVVAWYIIRMCSPTLPPDSSRVTILLFSILNEEEQLKHHAIWFIKIRWYAIIGWGIFITIACLILAILPLETFLPLYLLAILLTVLNFLYLYWAKRTKNTHRFIVTQILLDLVVLSGFLEFSGGLENPLYLLYLWHGIIAAVLLSRKDAFYLTFIAWLLLSLVAVGQMLEIVPHHTITIFPHHYSEHAEGKITHAAQDTQFVLGRLGAFAIIMGGTVYFVTLIMNYFHENRRRLYQTTHQLLLEAKEKEKVYSQLLQASKMATVGELAGRIAHEINNPIGIINAKVKLLISDFGNGQLPDKVLSDLQKIDKHTERIATITRGLLAFSRPSLGKKEPLDIHHVIQASLNLIEHQLAIARIKLQTSFTRSPLPVEGNFSELQQVILNIINNAIDAMPKGGELIITCDFYFGKEVCVTISDTGPGISSEILPHLFEPFFTTKPKEKGTGLGLAICQGLIRSHRGRIEVQSAPGKGTTFRIVLPKLGKGS